MRANALIEASLALCGELGDRDGIAECKARLGGVAAAQGKLERAETLYQESLSLYQEVGDRPCIAECLRGLASVAVTQADAAKAARLFGASLLPDERAGYDGMVAAARARLGDKAFAAAWASGRTMMLEQAVACALGKTDA